MVLKLKIEYTPSKKYEEKNTFSLKYLNINDYFNIISK